MQHYEYQLSILMSISGWHDYNILPVQLQHNQSQIIMQLCNLPQLQMIFDSSTMHLRTPNFSLFFSTVDPLESSALSCMGGHVVPADL